MTATSEPEKPSRWSALRPTVEPVMFVAFFVGAVMASPTTDLVMRQACKQFGLDRENCTANKDISTQVQRIATSFNLSKTIIEYLPGCIISIFTGPWTNVKGRKPFLISTLVGGVLSQCVMTYLSSLQDIKPYYLLFSSLPACISGGPILIVVSCFCYAIDVSAANQRFLTMAILMAIMSGVPVLANLVAPVLVTYGYPFLYGINGVFLLIILLYTIFLLPESVKVQKDVNIKLFTFDHFLETARTFFKRRPYNIRGMIITLSLLGCTSVFLSGEGDVKYQSVIAVYKWNLKDYSTYNAVLGVTNFVGTILGVYIGINLLHINELLLGVLMLGCHMAAAILLGLVPTPTLYYVISQFQCFSDCIVPITRGVVSNIVPHDDIGVIVSFMTSLEAFMPQLSAVFYATVYNASVASYPFAFHFLTASVGLLGIVCILTVAVMKRMGGLSEANVDVVNAEGKVAEEIVQNSTAC